MQFVNRVFCGPLYASFILCLLIGTIGAQTKVDSFPFIKDDDVVARLDDLHAEMLKHPDSTAHIVLFKKKGYPLGKYLRRFYGIEKMWNIRGFPSEKLVMHAGKDRDALLHEFWLVESGEVFLPKQFSVGRRLAERVTRKRLFDWECIGCTPAVPLNEWIFSNGLDYFGRALRANPHASGGVTIGRAALFLTDSALRRSKLRNDIYAVLGKEYGARRSRLTVRFVGPTDFAYLYIVPKGAVKRAKSQPKL